MAHLSVRQRGIALARHANARVPAQVYAGLGDNGREAAAAKLVEAGFGR